MRVYVCYLHSSPFVRIAAKSSRLISNDRFSPIELTHYHTQAYHITHALHVIYVCVYVHIRTYICINWNTYTLLKLPLNDN